MVNIEYDDSDPESILEAAKRLTGKPLKYFLSSHVVEDVANKGDLGTLVENHYFLINPGNSPEPDFSKAGVELKTTGLKKDKTGKFKAKERLVLSMINYESLVNEEWEQASLLKKCGHMLILFYEYLKSVPVIERRFIIEPMLYKLPNPDSAQIQADWEYIREKVRNGKAHELSEGDTFYLGACRKGSGGEKEKLRRQPFSDIPAKARAFSFKQGYLDMIIENHQQSLAQSSSKSGSLVGDSVLSGFKPFLGMTIEDLSNRLGIHKTSSMQKGFHRQLSTSILRQNDSSIQQLIKAGIEMKTIRVNKAWRPRESMSFPGFTFLGILNEDWDDSNFANKIEQKFLFVIFRTSEDGIERLEKVSFWNMPFEDREEARRVYEETKKRVRVNAKNLPGSKESPVAHVRPKARDSKDVIPTPQGDFHTKQCFWLNSSYIEKVIASLE